MKRRCVLCGKKRNIIEFKKSRADRSKYGVRCAKCVTELYVNSAGYKFDHSEMGVLRAIYTRQKRSNNERGHGNLGYTKLELHEWMKKNNFEDLLKKWADSGYKKDNKPSIDRVDDDLGYSFSNMRLVTWLENRISQYNKNRKGGVMITCVKVDCLTKDGEFVEEYACQMDASRKTGVSNKSISACVCGKRKSAGGYLWRWSEDCLEKI